MDRPGEKLKRVREGLKLTYRDVEAASQRIAERLGDSEYGIALSRLADIEHKGTVPTIYRLYTLCAIYRLELHDVLAWYGVRLDQIEQEAMRVGLAATHEVRFKTSGGIGASRPKDAPLSRNSEIDLNKTTFLSHLLPGWGSLPVRFLNGLDLPRCRYGLIGLEDRSMYPILHPGSLVLIDDRARISSGGWTNESDRPIYFFERRGGYLCGWCDLTDDQLVVMPHPSSQRKPSVFRYPAEIDLIGQVAGVAMLLESAKRSRSRSPGLKSKTPTS
jgi:transcriptional regulator with XRE-family HTH domain